MYGGTTIIIDNPQDLLARVTLLREEMREEAAKLNFEKAAELRDRIRELERRLLGLDGTEPNSRPSK